MSGTMSLLEMIITFLLIAGAIFRLSASIGMLHFSDYYLRAHSAAKAGTLPPLLFVLSVMLFFGDPLLSIKLIVLMLLYFFGSPTGIQLINRGAHVLKVEQSPETWIDELAESHMTDIEYQVEHEHDHEIAEGGAILDLKTKA